MLDTLLPRLQKVGKKGHSESVQVGILVAHGAFGVRDIAAEGVRIGMRAGAPAVHGGAHRSRHVDCLYRESVCGAKETVCRLLISHSAPSGIAVGMADTTTGCSVTPAICENAVYVNMSLLLQAQRQVEGAIGGRYEYYVEEQDHILYLRTADR